jgi:hypothetical protein
MVSRQEKEFEVFGFVSRQLRSGLVLGIIVLLFSAVLAQEYQKEKLRDQLVAAKEQNTTITEKLLREQIAGKERLDTLLSRQVQIYVDLQKAKYEINTLKSRKR